MTLYKTEKQTITHQLHIIDFLRPKACESLSSVFANREGHSLQSLLLGVHTNVRLHLNTQAM